ncbi:MAG TPA: hypothetical protein VNI01_09235 [Elusimicrobiota bacterium]|nr:hypothetical protein [Elusimicrobiota bacterium]
MGGDEVHVGSGGFRVHPRKAMEVLSRYQLPAPAMFLDLWLRCAHASGASRIRIDGSARGLCVRFDGRPLLEEELRDPSAILLGGGASARSRDLAFGLLGVLRTAPASVTVFSGDGQAGRRLWMLGLESWGIESAPFRGTAIEVDWGASPAPDWRARLGFLPAMLLAMVEVDERLLALPEYPIPNVSFRRGRVRGTLFMHHSGASLESRLDLHRAGIPVESIAARLPAPVRAVVNDEALELDASQFAAIRGRRLALVERIVGARCKDLALRVLEGFRPRMQAFAERVREPALRRSWAEGLGQAEPLARETEWLRHAADGLLGLPEEDCADPALSALWSAPLFFGAAGGTVSLAQLEAQSRALGCVPFQRRPSQSGQRVWCPSYRDVAALTRRFGARIREEG